LLSLCFLSSPRDHDGRRSTGQPLAFSFRAKARLSTAGGPSVPLISPFPRSRNRRTELLPLFLRPRKGRASPQAAGSPSPFYSHERNRSRWSRPAATSFLLTERIAAAEDPQVKACTLSPSSQNRAFKCCYLSAESEDTLSRSERPAVQNRNGTPPPLILSPLPGRTSYTRNGRLFFLFPLTGETKRPFPLFISGTDDGGISFWMSKRRFFTFPRIPEGTNRRLQVVSVPPLFSLPPPWT